MKAFIQSFAVSFCFGGLVIAASALNQVYSPEVMKGIDTSYHQNTSDHHIAALEVPQADTFDRMALAMVNATMQPPDSSSIDAGSSAQKDAAERISKMTPDEMLAAGQTHLNNSRRSVTRMDTAYRQTDARRNPNKSGQLYEALTESRSLLDLIQQQEPRLDAAIKNGMIDEGRKLLEQIDVAAQRIAELEERVRNLPDDEPQSPPPTEPIDEPPFDDDMGGFGVADVLPGAGGAGGGGGGLGTGGGGGGGGGSIGGSGLAIAGLAAAVLGANSGRNRRRVASPFEPFSQAPEAGGEAPASANPQMLGD
jgi:uncharacterized membrane protein YgcG